MRLRKRNMAILQCKNLSWISRVWLAAPKAELGAVRGFVPLLFKGELAAFNFSVDRRNGWIDVAKFRSEGARRKAPTYPKMHIDSAKMVAPRRIFFHVRLGMSPGRGGVHRLGLENTKLPPTDFAAIHRCLNTTCRHYLEPCASFRRSRAPMTSADSEPSYEF